jgi:hypothetical protein
VVKTHGALAIAALVLTLTMSAATVARHANAGEPEGRPASDAETAEFAAVISQYQYVHFRASVDGDLSEYPHLFANDPAVDVARYSPDCPPLIEQEHDGVAEALASLGVSTSEDARNVPVGLLSCVIAEQIDYHRNVSAWKEAQDEAAREGRQPSTQDLAAGIRPVEPISADDWSNDPIYVISAQLRGENDAHVVYAGSPAEQHPSPLFHLLMTRIDGTWHITAAWTSFKSA